MRPFLSIFAALSLCVAGLFGQTQTTPLSGVPTASPARVDRLLGHTAAGAPRHFTIGSLIGVYNVKHYGAIGNGTTDDTDAIAAAFAAAPAGATIVFPAGTYLLKSPISIGVDHLTIFGYGAKIISDATGQDRKFTISGRTGIRFEGLRIDGGERTTLAAGTEFNTYTPRDYPGTLHFLDSKKCAVVSCGFTGLNWPITLLGDCDGITIENNDFARYYAGVYSYFSGATTTEKSPHNVRVSGNRFAPGLHPIFPVAPQGEARDYTVDSAWCSGAIKFRGHENITEANGRWFEKHGHIISGNQITRAGQMGIELQAVGDCTVTGNTIYGCEFGVSLSFVQRATVAANTISDASYAGIEVDGRTDGVTTSQSSDGVALTGNIIDGRDEFGREHIWIVVCGIILDHQARNVSISGGAILHCRTGIKIRNGGNGITIDSVRIKTNSEGGYGFDGDYTGGPWNQGILVSESSNIHISNVTLEPAAGSWQRQIYLYKSTGIRVSKCDITANNCAVLVSGGSDTEISDCVLRMGTPLGGDPATQNFVLVNGVDAPASAVRVLRNRFIGTGTAGVYAFAASTGTVSGVTIEGNDTAGATATHADGMLVQDKSTGGTITGIAVRANTGPSTSPSKANSFLRQYTPVSGTVTDTPDTEVYFTSYAATVNLISAAGYTDREKIVYYFEGTGTVTINPASGEKINGSTSAITLTTVGTSVRLRSTGSEWFTL